MRDDKHMSWDDIAKPENGVRNIAKKVTTRGTVRRAYDKLVGKRGKHKGKYDYANCGRKPWKLTPEIQKFVMQRFLKLRKDGICTSRTLQAVLRVEKGVNVVDSAIRRFLLSKGYKWLRRCQKRKYSKEDRKARLAFAKAAVRLSKKELALKLALSIDGIVISLPPKDEVGRWNHCHQGETHMWRKPSESFDPELAGDAQYFHQVGIDRAVPMWGGLSAGGFAELIFHKSKKLSADEWVGVLKDGTVTAALAKLNPRNRSRPWHLLCDNEGFLQAKEAKRMYTNKRIKLWQVPPRSPDMNPIEKYWSYLRRALRDMDLGDLQHKRRPLTKPEYIARIKAINRRAKSQRVAANMANGFRKVCQRVIKAKGAGVKG